MIDENGRWRGPRHNDQLTPTQSPAHPPSGGHFHLCERLTAAHASRAGWRAQMMVTLVCAGTIPAGCAKTNRIGHGEATRACECGGAAMPCDVCSPDEPLDMS